MAHLNERKGYSDEQTLVYIHQSISLKNSITFICIILNEWNTSGYRSYIRLSQKSQFFAFLQRNYVNYPFFVYGMFTKYFELEWMELARKISRLIRFELGARH